MRQWIRSHLTYANVMVTILAFVVLGGGSAVALDGSNTVFTDDIVDNQVSGSDVRNDTLSGGGLGAADLKPGSVGTSEVTADSLRAGDLAPSSVHSSEVANGSLTGDDVVDDSLTGTQVDEATLDLPGLQERAKRIDYDQPDTDDTLRQIGYQNGFYILARCDHGQPSSGYTRLRVYATSDFDSTIRSFYERRLAGGLNPGGDPDWRNEFYRLTPLAPPQLVFTFDPPIEGNYADNGAQDALAHAIYHNAQAVVSLDLEMIANATDDRCQVYGTMLSATG